MLIGVAKISVEEDVRTDLLRGIGLGLIGSVYVLPVREPPSPH